jgi:threonine/homoserine/homoserine lactone efflux protein
VLVLGIEVAVVWLLFVRLIRRPALRLTLERYGSWLDRAFGALLLVLAVLFMLSALPTLLA